MVARSFWGGKRVFLTGHTGFKGSWLAFWLHELGARVHGYALDPLTMPNAYRLLDVPGILEGETLADVCDRPRLAKALSDARPEIVFHLAAQALVRRGYREPALTFETNVMGTVGVLEAVRACEGVESVLVVTSDKTYAHPERGAQREDDPLGGADPYSASKAGAEIVAAAYRSSFFAQGPRLATARAGNVIGGGDWSEDRLVPDIVRASERGEPLVLRYPEAVRPWQFVGDALAGYLTIAEALAREPAVATAWNLGPSGTPTMSVEQLARGFIALYDPRLEIRIERDAGPRESAYLWLDPSRAQERLGWSPRFDAAASVAACARWYGVWRERGDLRATTLEQLGVHDGAGGSTRPRGSSLIFEPTPIPGAFVVRLRPHADERGFFARTFCADEFAQAGLPVDFCQQSLARSRRRGTLRGMHLQLEPHGEDKFVRCVRGRIFDAIADLRPSSPAFKRSFWIELDAESGDALFVPRGCAHGYQTLVDETDVLYAMTSRYAPAAARSIRWNDPELAIAWPLADPVLSEADRNAPSLAAFLTGNATLEVRQ